MCKLVADVNTKHTCANWVCENWKKWPFRAKWNKRQNDEDVCVCKRNVYGIIRKFSGKQQQQQQKISCTMDLSIVSRLQILRTRKRQKEHRSELARVNRVRPDHNHCMHRTYRIISTDKERKKDNVHIYSTPKIFYEYTFCV